MNRYKHYAPAGITDCGVHVDAAGLRTGSASDDLSDQPCRLASARGKPATIRVGGGENWDKTFRAVKAANEARDGGYKYHAVGGAAGTVSPMGWTFQGGLGGTTGGRMHGFGVDQILQIEMVLPNGHHVRFGPTEWEDASEEGFTAPRSMSVSGVCRDNPEELDEAQWTWSGCPEDSGINFDDLWFAVGGGGGGTWGVITSISLQLHDYVPFSILFLDIPSCPDTVSVAPIIESFRAKWILLPSMLNVTQSESHACGSPDGTLALACYGESAGQNAMSAWKKYLESNTEVLSEFGLSATDASPCFGLLELNDYGEIIQIKEGPYIGKLGDSPAPPIQSMANEKDLNVLIPKSWVEENPEVALAAIATLPPGNPYYAFGTGTNSASDQANSLSSAHRGCGLKIFLDPDAFFSIYFASMYDTSDKANFPAFLGSNHAGTNMVGPRKDDWTKACPKELTQKERDENCISLQEAIYGTKTLARLEAIKESVDPNYMFDCNGCIGNNRAKNSEQMPTEKETENSSTSGGFYYHVQMATLTTTVAFLMLVI